MLAFGDMDRNTTMSIKAKKALIQKLVFPKPSTNLIKSPVISFELTHTKITKEIIAQVLVI